MPFLHIKKEKSNKESFPDFPSTYSDPSFCTCYIFKGHFACSFSFDIGHSRFHKQSPPPGLIRRQLLISLDGKM
jgi:hypothetical protein